MVELKKFKLKLKWDIDMSMEEKLKNQIGNQIFLLEEHTLSLKEHLEDNEVDIFTLRDIQSKMTRIVSLLEMVVIPL